jgi:hypothetical protein
VKPNVFEQALELGCPGLPGGRPWLPSRHLAGSLVRLRFAHQIETAQPSPSTAFAMLRAASSMIAHALASAGEVCNGSSRMKEGVRLRSIGQEILVASTGFKPQCEKRLRRLRSDPRPKDGARRAFRWANFFWAPLGAFTAMTLQGGTAKGAVDTLDVGAGIPSLSQARLTTPKSMPSTSSMPTFSGSRTSQTTARYHLPRTSIRSASLLRNASRACWRSLPTNAIFIRPTSIQMLTMVSATKRNMRSS